MTSALYSKNNTGLRTQPPGTPGGLKLPREMPGISKALVFGIPLSAVAKNILAMGAIYPKLCD